MHLRHGRALGPLLAFVLAACGGVTKFEDTTPIRISGPTLALPPLPTPTLEPKRVELRTDRIEIRDKIHFQLAQAVILPESHGLLDEVVEVLKQNPGLKKVEIIGHTSDEGTEKYNQELSDGRAKAVLAYLVEHGVESGRLSAKGLGESKPIADNATEAGREQNRRVEFLIVEPAPKGEGGGK